MTAEHSAKRAADFESIAQLLEDMIPNFKKDEDRQFYHEVMESYRAAARDIVRKHRPTKKAKTLQNSPSHWR